MHCLFFLRTSRRRFSPLFVGPAFPPFPFCLVSDIPLLQAYLQSRLSGEVHEEQLVMGKVVVDLVAKVLF